MDARLSHELTSQVFSDLAPGDADELADRVMATLYPQGLELIERNLGEAGGQAVLLSDLFAMTDLWSAVKSVTGASLKEKAELLGKLVLAWRKLRQIREPLDEVEFKVMLAVKRGNASVPALALATGLSEAQVSACVSALSARQYNRKIPLVEQTDDDQIVTRF